MRRMILILLTGFARQPLRVQDDEILFDDFNYLAYDDPLLSEHGWIVRRRQVGRVRQVPSGRRKTSHLPKILTAPGMCCFR
jgi:hypothetical protein